MDIFLYFFIGVFSSYVGTTTGLAGGVILFAFLGGFFPINAVVPLHASLQIGSNASRVMFLWKQLDIKVLLLFLILVIPGAYFGSKASMIVNRELLQQALGLIIIFIAFKNLNNREAIANVNHSKWIIIILGFLSSFFGMIIGVVGPFLAPFFLRAGFKGKGFIATKSACQLAVQLVKTIFFITLLQFNFLDYGREIFIIFFGILIGSFIGKKTLDKVSAGLLSTVTNVLLIILGGKMLL